MAKIKQTIKQPKKKKQTKQSKTMWNMARC